MTRNAFRSLAFVAIPLLGLLAACAAQYEDRCLGKGVAAGTPELRACVTQEIQHDRWNRKRHRTVGGGGGAR